MPNVARNPGSPNNRPSADASAAELCGGTSSNPANEYLMMVIAEKAATQAEPAVAQIASLRTADGRQMATTSAEPAAVDAKSTAVRVPDQWNSDRGIQSGDLKSQSPLVSICITTYNRAALVRESIDSVLRQTYRNVEVVVVDDGSTDNTRCVLETYGSAIRAVHNETNQGMAFSKNRALLF